MKRSLLVSIMVGGLLVFFQNCGTSVEFSSQTDALDEKSSLVPLALEEGEQDMANVTTGEASGTLEQGQTPGKKDDLPPAANVVVNNNNEEEGEDEDDNNVNAEWVACILEGPGKSLKLGLIEEDLGGVNSVASSVCISRKACLEKVAAKFKVKGAYDRGYCAHNPNVVRLSDADLEKLLK